MKGFLAVLCLCVVLTPSSTNECRCPECAKETQVTKTEPVYKWVTTRESYQGTCSCTKYRTNRHRVMSGYTIGYNSIPAGCYPGCRCGPRG